MENNNNHPNMNLNYPYDDIDPPEKVVDDVVIDESNFTQYFFDVRRHKPVPGQCMARFRARAEFVDGTLKRDMVEILMHSTKGGDAAQKLMRKLAGATERDSIKVPLQMANDLNSGMTPEQVCEKVYEFDCEVFYYTDPANVPVNSKSWEIIRLIGVPKDKTMEITSNIQQILAEEGLDTPIADSSEECSNGQPNRDRELSETLGQGTDKVVEG